MYSISTIILIIFSSLLGSAFSHTCLGCFNPNGTTCDAKDIECVGNDCMTVSQNYRLGDKAMNSLYRGCANKTMCGAFGSMTQDPHAKIRTYAVCCNGKKCNTQEYNIPAENTTLNGVICPSSYCEGTTDDCNKDLKEQKCTGSENLCINYRGRMQNPDMTVIDYSLKACINGVGCDYNVDCLIGAAEVARTELTCGMVQHP